MVQVVRDSELAEARGLALQAQPHEVAPGRQRVGRGRPLRAAAAAAALRARIAAAAGWPARLLENAQLRRQLRDLPILPCHAPLQLRRARLQAQDTHSSALNEQQLE